MKSIKEFLKDKKGVFGLTSVQAFFVIILSISILAYVIVIVLGSLGGTTILSRATTTTYNQTGWINGTSYNLSAPITSKGFTGLSILYAFNGSNLIPAGNYSLSALGIVTNTTADTFNFVNFTFSYSSYTAFQNNLDTILTNTSTGVTGFFSSINPVYAILAILVIILVLVVLVRVVQSPSSSRAEAAGL